MSSIQAIDRLIEKLKKRNEPLNVKECQALGDWLEKYVSLHDEKLLNDVFIEKGVKEQ